MQPNPPFDDLVASLDRLPTLPGIAARILNAARDETTSLADLGDILATDPPLSAKVLRLINSPFYGLSSRITTVGRAVSMLGATTVKNLALSFSLVNTASDNPRTSFDYTRFWKDSLFSAVIAKHLARRLRPDAEEECFMLGLLHNIGILVINESMPDQYSLVLNEVDQGRVAYEDAERRVLGFTHMDVGAHLARSWNLPEDFSRAIQRHHEPEKLGLASDDIQTNARILHLLSLCNDFRNEADKPVRLGIIEHFCERYGYRNRLDIDKLLRDSEAAAREIFPVFDVKLEDGGSYFAIIEAAREQLISLSAGFMQSLFQQQQEMQRLNEQASRDGLTQLINFQSFHESLHEEIRRALRVKSRLCILMLDIDHFKQINDTYGHEVGNVVLRRVSKVLQDAVRRTDIVARYGGEEFAIALPGAPLEPAVQLAERIVERVAAQEIHDGHVRLQCTISVGVAEFAPQVDLSNSALIRKADAALYKAKRNGRNQACPYSYEVAQEQSLLAAAK